MSDVVDACDAAAQDANCIHPHTSIMNSRCVFLEPHQVTSLKVKDFAGYWRSKVVDGNPPPPDAIDPAEIVALLPYLVIAQVEAAPLRVRYRLVGTQVVDAHGADYTNRYLDECGFLIEAELTECYRRVQSGRAPIFMYYEWERSDWPRTRSKVGASECGFFPLSTDGRIIDRAISIADPGVQPHPAAGQR